MILKKIFYFICLMMASVFTSCSQDTRVASEYLSGDSQRTPTKMQMLSIPGEPLFDWTDLESLNEMNRILQSDYHFSRSESPRNTQKGYELRIIFDDKSRANFLIYGTGGTSVVWLVTYLDPDDPSERLVKGVRVETSRLPEKLSDALGETSLLKSIP